MDELKKMFEDMDKIKKDAKEKLPEALTIQKKKFLIAINECDEHVNQDDEEFVKKVMDDSHRDIITSLFKRDTSKPWNDSLVNINWEEDAFFDLNKYLDCSKIVFLTYSGVTLPFPFTSYKAAAEYVLRHARRFGDTSKTIFETNNDATNAPNEQKTSHNLTSLLLPESKFMNKIEQLIADLRRVYDETKFIILNTNVTYITLLMLRRFVKKEAECVAAFKRIHTHDSYVKLCPRPLDNQLPKSDTSELVENLLKKCAYLAIHAYLNIDDERTKRALRVTCVQFMEWTGLQLPHLFFKVVELYEIDAGKLWDLLNIEKTAESLSRLANVYYEKYQTLKSDPTKTQHWFPFCRTFDDDYHKNLSGSQNIVICMILAYLVDLKIGFNKSTVRLSHWANSKPLLREDSFHKGWQEFAENLIKRMDK